MRKLIYIVLILGFLFVDLIFFHDVFNCVAVITGHHLEGIAANRDSTRVGEEGARAAGRGAAVRILRDRYLTARRCVCRQLLGFVVHRLKLG